MQIHEIKLTVLTRLCKTLIIYLPIYNCMRSPSFNILTSMNASCKDLFTCMYDLSHSDVNMLGILLRQKQAKTLDETCYNCQQG